MNKIYSDFHNHVFGISNCAREDATIENYLKACKEQGITSIGFSDHLWDSDVRYQKENEWFHGNDMENIKKLKKLIPTDTQGIKIYYGCEVDVDKDNIIGLSKENAKYFDYVLIATNHFHAKGFEIYDDVDLNDLQLLKKITIEHFLTATKYDADVLKVICHPFVIHGISEENREKLLKMITDDEYHYCFKQAAKNNIAIEIHAALLGGVNFEKNKFGFSKEYTRMIKIANEEGCKFTIGSDSHWMSMFTHNRYGIFIDSIGIKEENIIQVL